MLTETDMPAYDAGWESAKAGIPECNCPHTYGWPMWSWVDGHRDYFLETCNA